MNWFTNGSWKTTSAGLLTIIGGLTKFAFTIKAGNVTEESVMTMFIVVAGGVGLLFARDNDKSTEQVQASKSVNKTTETEIKQP